MRKKMKQTSKIKVNLNILTKELNRLDDKKKLTEESICDTFKMLFNRPPRVLIFEEGSVLEGVNEYFLKWLNKRINEIPNVVKLRRVIVLESKKNYFLVYTAERNGYFIYHAITVSKDEYIISYELEDLDYVFDIL